MIIKKFCQLIIDIDKRKGKNFSGIGLVLYDHIPSIPISSLQEKDIFNLPIKEYTTILDVLLRISTYEHPFHDGFHFLNKNFELTHVSQYFSTPIIENKNVEFRFGSRYRTAFYGSFIEDIYACGVIGNNHGPVIFRRGEKIDPYNFSI